MLAAIATLVGLLGLAPQGQIQEKRFDVQGWRITVSQDRFTGGVTCQAVKRGMRLEATTVVFKLGRHVDTSGAVYRLDLGPAHSLVDQPANQELRHVVEVGALLENPSAGVVALPLSQLAGIKRVDIRANVQTAPQTFDVSGLTAVLDLERSQACPTDSAPQRSTLTSGPAGANPRP